MSGNVHSDLGRRLRELRAPDEREAAERGLEVVRAAYAARSHVPRAQRPGLRPVVAALLAGAAALLVLTPAGASVQEWIENAVTIEESRPEPPRLPAPGSILTVDGSSAWIVRADGSRRNLGPYREATFSPRGLNVAVASGRELAAVNSEGALQWTLPAKAQVADPAWAPSGLRVAYRAGSQLRIVDGDGSPDAGLARRVAPVAPAWRPVPAGEPARDVLAWVDPAGRVRLADVAASGDGLRVQTRGQPLLLTWLADGRLAVVSDRGLETFDSAGRPQLFVRAQRDARPLAIAAAPNGERIALARLRLGEGQAQSELTLIRLDPKRIRQRIVFTGPGLIDGLAFSPDGTTIGFGWPAADSWLFVTPRPERKLVERVEALPGISSRFGGSRAQAAAFPEIVEWCCAAGR